MSSAILSLGSNLGDRAGFLRDAVACLQASGATVEAISSVYRTPPWGPVEQDDYYNLVLELTDPVLDSAGWLDLCHQAETAAGRERTIRWGPRTLDADVVAVWTGERPELSPELSDDERLTLPHPRAFERGFVLIPWLEMDPDADLPGYGPVADLVVALDQDEVAKIISIGPLGTV